MDGSILKEKVSFKMLGMTFSSICIGAVTASKKIGALIPSIEFLSPEVALYLYKSTIWLCMEYCCHIWAGAPGCYLELLDKLQNRICRIVVLSLCASLETLSHPQKVGSFSLFYKYCFGRCCLNFSSNCMPCSGCPVLYEVNPKKKARQTTKILKLGLLFRVFQIALRGMGNQIFCWGGELLGGWNLRRRSSFDHLNLF